MLCFSYETLLYDSRRPAVDAKIPPTPSQCAQLLAVATEVGYYCCLPTASREEAAMLVLTVPISYKNIICSLWISVQLKYHWVKEWVWILHFCIFQPINCVASSHISMIPILGHPPHSERANSYLHDKAFFFVCIPGGPFLLVGGVFVILIWKLNYKMWV